MFKANDFQLLPMIKCASHNNWSLEQSGGNILVPCQLCSVSLSSKISGDCVIPSLSDIIPQINGMAQRTSTVQGRIQDHSPESHCSLAAEVQGTY